MGFNNAQNKQLWSRTIINKTTSGSLVVQPSDATFLHVRNAGGSPATGFQIRFLDTSFYTEGMQFVIFNDDTASIQVLSDPATHLATIPGGQTMSFTVNFNTSENLVSNKWSIGQVNLIGNVLQRQITTTTIGLSTNQVININNDTPTITQGAEFMRSSAFTPFYANSDIMVECFIPVCSLSNTGGAFIACLFDVAQTNALLTVFTGITTTYLNLKYIQANSPRTARTYAIRFATNNASVTALCNQGSTGAIFGASRFATLIVSEIRR